MNKYVAFLAIGTLLPVLSVSETTYAANLNNYRVETIAVGLDSPRGLAFGPDGALYVTEAGRGPLTGFNPLAPTLPSPSVPGSQLQFGLTGAITRIDVVGKTLEQVVTGLPSAAIPAGFAQGIFPDAADASGPNDIAFAADGTAYIAFGFASNPESRQAFDTPEFQGRPQQLASLAKVNLLAPDPNETLEFIADLGSFEAANNSDGTDVVSNPFSVALLGDSVLILDTGANALLQTNLEGDNLELKALFNDVRIFPNPGIPGIPDAIPTQQVPTAITVGPDNALYVSEYTGFPFPPKAARIFRIDGTTQQPQVFLEGFTNLIDVGFDAAGNLWALEYDSDSVLGESPFGSLIKVSQNNQRTVVLDNLLTPTGLAFDANGSVYVANKGFVAGEGEVLKVTAVPEPGTTVGVILAASLGVVWRRNKTISISRVQDAPIQ